jgi:hypothetical protein
MVDEALRQSNQAPKLSNGTPIRGVAALKRVNSSHPAIQALQHLDRNYLSTYLDPEHEFIHSISSECIGQCFNAIHSDLHRFLTAILLDCATICVSFFQEALLTSIVNYIFYREIKE